MNLKDNYPKILLFVYAIIWIVAAINPRYRSVWMDENILPVLFVLLLIFTYKKFRFSNFSYTLIFAFLTLHAIGGHYSYAEVPLFDWIKEQYELTRNHYDRVVHFLFGVLFFLPFHEIITRIFRVPKGWKSLTITLFIVLSMKEFFEIIEYSYTAVRNNNLTTTNYLGEQGDVFDSIKDVTLGFIGAIISMITISIKKVF
jgi:putative membrane protein